MFSKSKLAYISPPRSRSKRPRASLPALLLGLFGSACGERFELGEIMQNLGDTPIRNADQIGTLIVDGAEDADAVLDGYDLVERGLGDVDGDGLADLFDRARRSILFGGPRPKDGLFTPAEGASFTRWPHTLGLVNDGPIPAGDVDGDGIEDLSLGGMMIGGRGYESPLPDSYEPIWSTQSALLMYGTSERTPGDSMIPGAARIGDPEPTVFPTERALNINPYGTSQSMSLRGIGDIDADGYDDFTLTVELRLSGVRFDAEGGTLATNEQTELDTYLFYGSPQRFAISPSANTPAARLAGVSRVDALGDVDGDGFEDVIFIAIGDESVHLVQGSAERLGGDVAFDAGVEIEGASELPQGTGLGDLDGDGFGDFTLGGASADRATVDIHLFYGGPTRSSQALHVDFADATFRSPPYNGLTALGDWNGDGHNDLLLSYARPTSGAFLQFEARVIPGMSERYSGRYDTAGLEPVAARPLEIGSFTPVGDIDGDGLADVAFTGFGVGYIKYGGSLSGEIR